MDWTARRSGAGTRSSPVPSPGQSSLWQDLPAVRDSGVLEQLTSEQCKYQEVSSEERRERMVCCVEVRRGEINDKRSGRTGGVWSGFQSHCKVNAMFLYKLKSTLPQCIIHYSHIVLIYPRLVGKSFSSHTPNFPTQWATFQRINSPKIKSPGIIFRG